MASATPDPDDTPASSGDFPVPEGRDEPSRSDGEGHDDELTPGDAAGEVAGDAAGEVARLSRLAQWEAEGELARELEDTAPGPVLVARVMDLVARGDCSEATMIELIAGLGRSVAAIEGLRAHLVWGLIEPLAGNTLEIRSMIEEIALRIGHTYGTVSRMLDLGMGMAATPALATAMNEGRVGSAKATQILRDTEHLDPDRREHVINTVIDRDPETRNLPDLRHLTRKLAEWIDPRWASEQHARAKANRCVWIDKARHGMAFLHAYLPAINAHQIYATLTTIALATGPDLPNLPTGTNTPTNHGPGNNPVHPDLASHRDLPDNPGDPRPVPPSSPPPPREPVRTSDDAGTRAGPPVFRDGSPRDADEPPGLARPRSESPPPQPVWASDDAQPVEGPPVFWDGAPRDADEPLGAEEIPPEDTREDDSVDIAWMEDAHDGDIIEEHAAEITRTLGNRRADALTDLFHPSGPFATGTPLDTIRPRLVVVTRAEALLGSDEFPGELVGYGPLPATAIRQIAQDATWQAIYTDPATGRMTAAGTRLLKPGHTTPPHHPTTNPDTHPPHTRQSDTGHRDTDHPRSRPSDSGPHHSSPTDTCPQDSYSPKSSPPDTGHLNSGPPGSGRPPTAPQDSGPPDSSPPTRPTVLPPEKWPAETLACHSYRPSPSIQTTVTLRDQTCRFPGCQRPAWACDLDHRVPFDPGQPAIDQTVASNMQPLCRPHHRLKTLAGWDWTRDIHTGILTITSPQGRIYRLAPPTPTIPPWEPATW